MNQSLDYIVRRPLFAAAAGFGLLIRSLTSRELLELIENRAERLLHHVGWVVNCDGTAKLLAQVGLSR